MKKLVMVALLVLVMAGQTLLTTAPPYSATPLNPAPADMEPVPGVCLHPENVIATMADGYIAFVSATPIHPAATEWPEEQRVAAEKVYGEIIRGGYAGPRGFGSLEAWARAFGITQAPAACPGPDCCNAGGALRFMYVPETGNRAGWYDFPDGSRVPAIQSSCASGGCPERDAAYHELAHIWDFRNAGVLSGELDRAMEVVRKADRRLDVDDYYGRKAPDRYLSSGQSPMQRHGDFPSAYFDTVDPRLPLGGEHFAETVAAYFLIADGDRFDFPVCWADEDPRCPAGAKYEYDRYDFIADLFRSTIEGSDASD